MKGKQNFSLCSKHSLINGTEHEIESNAGTVVIIRRKRYRLLSNESYVERYEIDYITVRERETKFYFTK